MSLESNNNKEKISRRAFLGYLTNITKDFVSNPNLLTLTGLTTFILGSPISVFPSIPHKTPKFSKELEDLIFETPLTLKPPKGVYNRKEINKWRNRYIGADETYTFNDLSYKLEKNFILNSIDHLLFNGWNDRLNDGSINFIYEKCKNHNMPPEIIFLMFAESHGNKFAESRFAKGYWQFTKATGKAYGLRIGKSIDERTDFKKSTDAAIRLLRDNYKMTFVWEKSLVSKRRKITSNDRMLWAMWSYNMSPRKVRKYFLRLKGDPVHYAQTIKNINYESSNYVNKIFGVYYAVKHLRHNPPRTDVNAVVARIKQGKRYIVSKTPQSNNADSMYAGYKQNKIKLSGKERLERLTLVKNLYSNSNHSTEYKLAAIDVINREVQDIKISFRDEFTVKRSYKTKTKTGSLTTLVEIDDDGDLSAKVVQGDKELDVEFAEYQIRRRDRIHHIALRLSGDINNKYKIIELIKDINPEIKNINKIYPGDTIKVPGIYIQVPNSNLTNIVKEYYPNQPLSDAKFYVKYLNNKKEIKPGDTILVPVI
jgi:hypothetical protein